MATQSIRFNRGAVRPALVFGSIGVALLLTATACSKRDRDHASDAVKSAYAETKSAMSETWDHVKAFSFEKRDKFTANANALAATMDAQVAEVRAKYAGAKASASRRAALEELKNSEADYKQKVAALGHATADTWESAKQKTIVAWERLQAAYHKAQAE